jgi:hypothetical protein
MKAIKRILLLGLASTALLFAGCEGAYLTVLMSAVVMPAVLMSAPITAVGGRMAVVTTSSAEPTTTTATATTISTAIALAFIILAAAGFTEADMWDMVEVADTGSRQLTISALL